MLPRKKHLAVIGYFILAFLGPQQAVRIDILEADEDPFDPRTSRLGNKIRQFMAERIDLDDKADLEALTFAQLDQLIEDRFPVLIPGEIVVRDKETIES